MGKSLIGTRHCPCSMIDGLCTLQITQEYLIAHQHDDVERMDLRLITNEEPNKGTSLMRWQGIFECTWEWCWEWTDDNLQSDDKY